MLPERSIAAKSAKAVFFDHLNEIDIFIEDTEVGSEKLYLKILSRAFNGKYKINKIFPLGGRNSVIKEFETNKTSICKPTLYIVDGDLYLLMGDTPKNVKGLFSIPFYCIENILLDSEALIKITEEEDVTKNEQEIKDDISFDNWLSKNILLLDLFIEYAVCMIISPAIQSVSFPLSKLISSGDGLIDEKKTTQRINDIQKKIISNAGLELYNKTKSKIYDTVNVNELNLLKYVSGKDHLFPLMEKRIRNITGSRTNNMTLKQRIGNICSFQQFNNIQDFVLKP